MWGGEHRQTDKRNMIVNCMQQYIYNESAELVHIIFILLVMSAAIYKIVVLGEGTLTLNQEEWAKPPSQSNTSTTSSTRQSRRLSMPAISRR
jgi:hypothetical protein